jgi:hypothetical protein
MYATVAAHMQRATFRENALRVIAVLGLIAILLLGAWGIIQIAFALPTFFSGLGGNFARPTPKESISLTLPRVGRIKQCF